MTLQLVARVARTTYDVIVCPTCTATILSGLCASSSAASRGRPAPAKPSA